MPGYATDEHHRRFWEGCSARRPRAATDSGLHGGCSGDIGAWDRRHRRARCCGGCAVGTWAIGGGAPAAIFSVVSGVVLKPLPFHEPERLVGLYHRGPGINIPLHNQAPATYFTYLDNQRSFEGIG